MCAAAVALAYYSVATFPVLQISSEYFGRAGFSVGMLLWAAASVTLATPWLIFWHADRHQIAWRLPVALIAATVPPIGIIGWASPLTAAGFLFPGLAVLGLFLTVLTCIAFGVRSWNLGVTMAAATLIANLSYEGPPPTTSSWVALNTEFDSIHASNDPMREFSIAEQIQARALDTPGRVIVFPELILWRWNDATEIFWKPTLDKLQARGSTIVVGAGSPSAASPDEYRNTVIIRGTDEPRRFDQRIPVPVTMWKPWGGKDRVPLNLFGTPTLDLAGERAAILICYEQLLPWPYMTALWHRPTVIVGISNATWTKATVIPKNQSAALQAWGRLLSMPVISAINY
jgi:hypothetical protein